MFQHLKTLTLLCLLTCSNQIGATEKIHIYAGAGMMDAVNQLIDVYQQTHSVKITPVYASSSSNARQIANGAPADIYISANKKWVNYLIDKKVVTVEKVNPVARNEIVLIAPTSQKTNKFSLNDASQWNARLANEKLAIAEPHSVPVGIYARQSLSSLGVWEEIQVKTVHTKTVRAVLALVERQEAALGIVFRTDALISDKVSIVDTFPADSHKPIVFTMAQITQNQEVSDFADFINSPAGQNIWLSLGFLPAKK